MSESSAFMALQVIQSRIDLLAPHYTVVEQNPTRLTLLDKRYGVTFTYLSSQFISKLKGRVNDVFWSATRGNVVAVPVGEDPFRLEAQLRVDESKPNTFKVLSFKRETDTVLVQDLSTQVSKQFKLRTWLANLKRNSVSSDIADPSASAQSKLHALAPGRFQVISSDTVDGHTVVSLLEVETGKTFSHRLAYVVHRLKADSRARFDRTSSNKVRKATNLERYGVESPLQSSSIKEKLASTLQEKYGDDIVNVSQLPSHLGKFRETSLKNHGVSHPMKDSKVAARATNTSKENHDGVHHLQHPEVIKRIRNTNVERYGSETPFGSPVVLAKAKSTLLANYGVENAQHIPGMQQKLQQNRVEAGTQTLVDGKTMRERAVEIGSAYSFVQRLVLHYGMEEAKPLIDSYTPGGSSLTTFTASLFSEFNPILDRKLPGTNFRPDLRFEAEKVIVEADGLYWHSDGSKNETWNPDRKYHSKKLKAYEDLGYRSLFFRSDEILNKTELVKSIVLNALQKNSSKVHARKCSIKAISPSFFSKYHLMGEGQGRCYGLVYKGEIVAGIQVKMVSKEDRLLDVSRFACRSYTSVIGGWSRLIEHALREESPLAIQTFIDRRYGNGRHLNNLGWEFVREEPSFQWTDGVKTIHRMKFPSSTGYDNGFFKIWDCGQAKWTRRTATK